jgi:hypothetical protein
MHRPGLISIWFFIGVLLLIYGLLIFGVGIYEVVAPAPTNVVLANLHPAIWWGALLIGLGAFYTFRFAPWREK